MKAWLALHLVFLVACAPTTTPPPTNQADAADLAKMRREKRDREEQERDKNAEDQALKELLELHNKDQNRGEEHGTSNKPQDSPPFRFPTSVAGFRLGESFLAAMRLCVRSGGDLVMISRNYKPVEDPRDAFHFVCTNEPSETGFDPEFVAGTVCASGNLCEVSLQLKDDNLIDRVVTASKKMRKKYGPPNVEEGQSFAQSSTECVDGVTGFRRDIWTWYQVGLKTSRMIVALTCKKTPAASVIYQTGEGLARRAEELVEKENNY